MDKFNRSFKLVIGTNDGGQLTIDPPFTVQFNIVRNTLSSANVASLRVFNLNDTNRRRISKDRFDFDRLKQVAFFAGYGSDLSLCFSGNVTRCYSAREGVDMVTTIEAFDGGFAYANAILENAQYPAGISKRALIEDLIQRLNKFGIEKGILGRIQGELSRGNSFDGPVIKTIQDVSGGIFFIDNGKGYILRESEIIRGAIRVISSETGLIGTPIKDQQIIELNIIFEPRLTIGQGINVQSSTFKDINGSYKITAITHNGIISDSVAGTATTKISCYTGQALVEVA